MKADLNQLAAIRHGTGPALVMAGPGSGKTFVLTHRILYLIQILGVSPNQILVLTFSKKAAAEMQERFENLYPNGQKKALFGTFHSVFLKILKKYAGEEIHVLGDAGKREIVKAALRQMAFPLTTDEFADEILREISLYKARGGSLSSYVPKTVMKEEFSEIVWLYEKFKAQSGGLDYEDIMLRCRDMLIKDESVLGKLQARFQYILVDEFQDINAVQYELLFMLSGENQNLFAVGDDDQSIYGFRGSNPAFMRRFLEDFKDCTRYSLNTNYRSRNEIVTMSGLLIAKNKNRLKKDIICANNMPEKSVFRERFSNKRKEYDRIGQILLREDNAAILFRTNDYPEYLLNKLDALGIHYSCQNKKSNLYERFVAKDIFSYMRIALNIAKNEDFIRIHGSDKPNLSMSDKEALKLADPFGAVIYLRKMAGYEEYLNHIEKNNPKQKEIILNDLEDLTELAKDYDDFATWFEAVNNMTEKKEADRDSSIQLLTIHASKGLEFDTVIIPDLNEGNIPSPHAAKEEDVEEERRLLYVAMTRAKHHLYLFAVENKTERIAPSRFLKDLHLKSQF